MRDWQPIETAPKDGKEIVGYYVHDDNPRFNSGPWTMAWSGKRWTSSWDGCGVIENESDFGTDYKDLPAPPTHWMPLPNPPTTQEGG